jgi:hypothetical protein
MGGQDKDMRTELEEKELQYEIEKEKEKNKMVGEAGACSRRTSMYVSMHVYLT